MGRGKGRVKRRGDSLELHFSYKGKRYRPTIPRLSASKKGDWRLAEIKLGAINADIFAEKFNFAEHFPDHPQAKNFVSGVDVLIRDVLRDWLEKRRRDTEPSTWRGYRSAVESVLVPEFGDIALGELTAADIRDWRHAQTHKSNKTLNNNIIPLRQIYEIAYQDELIDKNPLHRIKNLPKRSEKAEPFTEAEKSKILNVAEGQVRNILEFAFETGLRVSELVALEWNDVNLEQKRVYVSHVRTREGNKHRTKTATSERNVELNDKAIESLKRQQMTFPQ